MAVAVVVVAVMVAVMAVAVVDVGCSNTRCRNSCSCCRGSSRGRRSFSGDSNSSNNNTNGNNSRFPLWRSWTTAFFLGPSTVTWKAAPSPGAYNAGKSKETVHAPEPMTLKFIRLEPATVFCSRSTRISPLLARPSQHGHLGLQQSDVLLHQLDCNSAPLPPLVWRRDGAGDAHAHTCSQNLHAPLEGCGHHWCRHGIPCRA